MSLHSLFDLTGRTALVTGATKGLGRAFALALAEAGADIVIGGRDAEGAQAVADEIKARGRRTATGLGDITVRTEAQSLVDTGLEAFGAIDILVNNAGACIHKPALEVTDDEWHHVFSTNLDALWMMSQIVGGHMISRQKGSIINIGSMSGIIVNRPQWQPAYNASKAAVHHLTRSLAAEWGPHKVRVNALAPGYMKTDMSPVDEPQFQRYWIEDAPQQRYGLPEELGGAVVFLASDASSFVTGSVLVADGGYTAF
jgi:NAD(P)-dependent dehydrogenase (short-subunit alcohol dehydrogenase family)